jgi:poly(3-hydroxybutyrate) depolymerase
MMFRGAHRLLPSLACVAFVAVAAGSCQKPRTEIVLGMATDLKAPRPLANVNLRIFRLPEQTILDQVDLPISGSIDDVYELPGTFGVYSPNGSADRFRAVLTATDNTGATLVVRTAVMNLVPQKTLFARLGVVSACIGMTDCGNGMTCVDGRCVSEDIDSSRLPVYVANDEKVVSCASATMYTDTSTHQPLPVMGNGCAAGGSCQEGVCLAPSTSGDDASTPADTDGGSVTDTASDSSGDLASGGAGKPGAGTGGMGGAAGSAAGKAGAGGTSGMGGAAGMGGMGGAAGMGGVGGAAGTGGMSGGQGGAGASGGQGGGGVSCPGSGGAKASPQGMSAGCGMAPAPTDTTGTFAHHTLAVVGVDPVLVSTTPPTAGSSWTTRDYYVQLPINYNPSKPYPVLFGGADCGGAVVTNGQNGGFAVLDGTQTQAIQIGMSYVWPQGGAACFDDSGANTPDLPYFDALLNQVEASYCIDRGKVFVGGFGSGAWEAYMLGLARGGVVRGIATAGGGLRMSRPPASNGPIAALLLTGFNDTVDPTTGPTGSDAAMNLILQNNCCQGTTTVPWETTCLSCGPCVRYTGCPAGFPVVRCTPPPAAGHTDGGSDFKTAIWQTWMSLP